MVRYLVKLLVDFTHIDTLYKIHSAQGRRVEDVKLSGNFELCPSRAGAPPEPDTAADLGNPAPLRLADLWRIRERRGRRGRGGQ